MPASEPPWLDTFTILGCALARSSGRNATGSSLGVTRVTVRLAVTSGHELARAVLRRLAAYVRHAACSHPAPGQAGRGAGASRAAAPACGAAPGSEGLGDAAAPGAGRLRRAQHL